MIQHQVLDDGRLILIQRDDLRMGGTKTRFLLGLYDEDHLVYASPAQGGMQIALAAVARQTGQTAHIFVAERGRLHPRTEEAQALGACIHEIPAGRLNVIQARARDFAASNGRTRLLSFGGAGDTAEIILAQSLRQVADSLAEPPPQVWCASGSGTLTRALQAAFPDSDHIAVQVGREIEKPGRASIISSGYLFAQEARTIPPFPSCPHYDAKAWERCAEIAEDGALFWNVLGPSPTWMLTEAVA